MSDFAKCIEEWADRVADCNKTITQQAQELEKVKAINSRYYDDRYRLNEELAASQARCREMEAKRFPIMRGPSVPWEVMSPHESMAQKNHSQTLHKLAERGGLAPGEAWCVVSGIQYGIASKEQWQLWDAEWFKYAEQVNLHYSKLAQLQATLAALVEGLRRINTLAVHNHTDAFDPMRWLIEIAEGSQHLLTQLEAHRKEGA